MNIFTTTFEYPSPQGLSQLTQSVHAPPALILGTSDSSRITPEPVPEVVLLKARVGELENRLVEDQKKYKADLQVEQGRQRALDATAVEAAAAAMVKGKLNQIEQLLDESKAEKQGYYAKVELQVVKLSLAIAARILHREANVDALLLAGAVRVALDQLEKGAECTLRVPSVKAQQWESWIAEFRTRGTPITVVPDETMAEDDCRLETRLGDIDLGIQAQLAEIERGFMDLLQCRPSPSRNAEQSSLKNSRRQPASAVSQ